MEHQRSVVPRTPERNDLSDCRKPCHHYSGKLLRFIMRAIRCLIQLCADYLYLLCYPLCQSRRFHQNIIGRSAHTAGTCPKPRIGIVFLVQLMTLFTLAYAHNPQPVVDLDSGFNNYAIHFGQKTFQLVYNDDGIVMTYSELIRRHH